MNHRISYALRSAVLFSMVAACSGSDGGSAGAAGENGGYGGYAGGGSQDGWWCVCNAELSVGYHSNVTYEQVQTLCAQECVSYGGVQTIKPQFTVLDTPECDAFCAKADALNCGQSCVAEFWCAVDVDSCVEATRAKLECTVDHSGIECSENGLHVSFSGCSNFDGLCNP